MSIVQGPCSPGDFILTHGGEFFSRVIQFGQGLRFMGKDPQYTSLSSISNPTARGQNGRCKKTEAARRRA